MRGTLCLAALSATISSVRAAHQGFNYGAFFTDNTPKTQADFEAEFKTAQNLVGAPGGGFNSARLYTMLQWGTATDVTAAIPAAIATNTTLLLGLWCSAGDAIVTNELTALATAIATAIATHGTNFTDLVVGISVGSEDLYRASATGQAHLAGAGVADPAVLVAYIQRVRDAIKGTALAGTPVGHVDTWTEWVDRPAAASQAVIDAVDWVGMDAYSYWQSMVPNAAGRGRGLFEDALEKTRAAVGGKPVWVTETGFPVSGLASNEAVPSVENAKRFWDEVGCLLLFGKVDVWWYILRDAGRGTPVPSFGIVGGDLGTTPVFDISCKGVEEEDEESCEAD
ncbi:hypothetical protein C8A00DRAFT_12274 [Chaetomidium leptoderma]|uniref:glucan endo-1,3-beta-D-glucosidase n=1 Tax=Chaetomidium leptoderma TaxID=669021 RepID=A0AAN6VSJ6_9PEZI|nr:hypothetical protein C8A00DRAFT_12274 [Chaetomidium leptoderma]